MWQLKALQAGASRIPPFARREVADLIRAAWKAANGQDVFWHQGALRYRARLLAEMANSRKELTEVGPNGKLRCKTGRMGDRAGFGRWWAVYSQLNYLEAKRRMPASYRRPTHNKAA